MGKLDTPTRWDLNSLLQCGLNMDKFKDYLSTIEQELLEIEEFANLNILNESKLTTISHLIKQIESAESFYYCLSTEDVESSLLTSLNTRISKLKSHVRFIISNLQEKLSTMSEKQFIDRSNKINQKSFIVELKEDAEITSREEKFILNFSRETLSGLEDLYVQVRNNLRVKVNLDNQEKEISFSEASNLALSHPEQYKRIHVFSELNKTLETQSNIFAVIYNQMVNLRLNENKIRRTDYLVESLKSNGISKHTLNAMWNAVESNILDLSGYFKITEEEVGKEKFSWHELMTASQEITPQITFSQAIDGITKSPL